MYNPKTMKISRVLVAFTIFFLAWSVALNIGSCTHDDNIDIIDPGEIPAEYGDDVINTVDGWELDVAHSSVRWETNYRGTGALLSGRFNEFDASVNFIEDQPENITFQGSVNLFTINTGQPGRDEGCLVNTLGMNDDPDAVITSKFVEFDGKGGYNVVADLDFHGVTSEVDMKLFYTGATYVDASTPYTLAGLKAEFEMSAKTVFGIESSNIDNRVVVHLDINFRQY